MKLPEYIITKVNERMYRIRNYMIFLTLIIGDHCALLIDTGFGQSSLKEFIENHIDLKGKPLLVFNTHTHVDHCRGNFAFSTIHLKQSNVLEDGSLLGYQIYLKANPKEDFKRRFNIEIEGDFKENDYRHLTYRFVKENDCFDLGGITIRVIETPGHTKNDIALYWVEEKYLFVGDSFDTLIWAYFDNAATKEEYIAMIDHVLTLDIASIYASHTTRPREKNFLLAVKKALEEVNYAESQVTPLKDLPREGASALDFKTKVVQDNQEYQFKIQYHPSHFLGKKEEEGNACK